MNWTKCIAGASCAMMALPLNVFGASHPANEIKPEQVKHVLLISVDGLHALDLNNWIREDADSNLGQLARHANNYTNASSALPSDSYPGLAALVTGGSPQTTGFWYDVTYNRYLAPPATTTPYGIVGSANACADGQQGTSVGFDEEIDNNLTLLDGGGGINPKYLPRDPGNGCAPVYPHSYLRVNTIFNVAHDAGLYTAWIDKHPAYEWTNGPSGDGVADFWGPEINSSPVSLPGVNSGQYGCNPLPDLANAKGGTPDNPGNAWTDSTMNIQCYDTYKVNGVLNQIDGLRHDGKALASVPTIFGMNFQAVSVGQKLKGNGYSDVLGTPSAGLLSELRFVDDQIGRMVNELKKKGLYDSTLIIIGAKHGQSPIDVSKRVGIANGPNTILGAAEAFDISDDGSLIWLTDPSQTPAAVATLSLPENQTALGIQEIIAGQAMIDKWDSPTVDPRTPDIILKTNTGVIFTGGGKLSEHGGLNEDDYHVGLLIALPSFGKATIKSTVINQQVAPTILKALGLNPYDLKAVQAEGTTVLPFLF